MDFTFVVDEQYVDKRLDKAIEEFLSELEELDYVPTRGFVQKLIENGNVKLNGETSIKSSNKTTLGSVYDINFELEVIVNAKPQNIPLDIVYEDDDVIIINKQANLSCHPSISEPDGTLVNALLYHYGEKGLSDMNNNRPGIVHRLDKNTTGLLIVAKNNHSHAHLAKQFEERTIKRNYLAIICGVPDPFSGEIASQIGRDPNNRLRMTVLRAGGKKAITRYQTEEIFGDEHDAINSFSLVRLKLLTGRTHQIRVHMLSIGTPILGDPTYNLNKYYKPALDELSEMLANKHMEDEDFIKSSDILSSQMLHACLLGFIHPRTNELMTFKKSPNDNFKEVLSVFRDSESDLEDDE